jgi:DNA-binding NarL/FixJ family response regulator
MTPKTPRIFRNWYTRGGKRIPARGWCIRIQHQGSRRTLSLNASNRKDAALEAELLFRAIKASGWSGAPPAKASGDLSELMLSAKENLQSGEKSTPHYWKQCLVFRKYKGGALFSTNPVLSARIECDGVAFHCPLGTDNVEEAARRACDIYKSVSSKGWKQASELFSREFTLGLVWAQSPFCCTYTTLYSMVSDPPDGVADKAERKGAKTIAIIESDASVRRAVCVCLNQSDEFACVRHFDSVKTALDRLDPNDIDIVLLNRDLPEVLNSQAMGKISLKIPGKPVWTYGIYEDSDPIFVSVSGVRAGYILRRRHHNALLEPIFGAGQYRQFTAQDAFKKIRDYFQSFFADSPDLTPEEKAIRFSTREQEMVNFIRKGYIDKEIAAAAGISIWTVRKHLHNIYRKLNVNTRIEAVIRLIGE